MKAFELEYAAWCQQADMPEDLRAQLTAIENDATEQELRFGQIIAFGTAGMRGLMGAGINRMNVYTVRRAARGLGSWLNSTDLPKRCAIAYDSRHNSQLFAEVCAAALAQMNIQVFLYHRLAPTPMLSYAVRELGCGCGIVISASHNDGRYNGMKCYGPDGCQMTDEPAAIVFDSIQKTPIFGEDLMPLQEALDAGLVNYITEEVWQSYYNTVLAERVGADAEALKNLKVLYTPLNGTGNIPVRAIFDVLGVPAQVVKEQEEPDGDFTTCPYPNPETDEALAVAFKTAETTDVDIIVGTDPDADRIAVAARTPNGWRKFSGNELGCLLLDFILSRKTVADGEIVRSIVSSPLADKIAAHYGVKAVSVLTGFKYIGGEILRLEEMGKQDQFIFGFEESCGYLKGTYARDKDAVVAAMLVAEMAATCKAEGRTLAQQMDLIYDTYGYYRAGVISVEMAGLEGPGKIAAFVDGLRNDPADSLCGAKIVSTVDYRSGECVDRVSGEKGETGLPSSNVYELNLDDGAKIIVRPSGTEPKLKIYFSAVAATEEASLARLDELKAEMSARLDAMK